MIGTEKVLPIAATLPSARLVVRSKILTDNPSSANSPETARLVTAVVQLLAPCDAAGVTTTLVGAAGGGRIHDPGRNGSSRAVVSGQIVDAVRIDGQFISTLLADDPIEAGNPISAAREIRNLNAIVDQIRSAISGQRQIAAIESRQVDRLGKCDVERQHDSIPRIRRHLLDADQLWGRKIRSPLCAINSHARTRRTNRQRQRHLRQAGRFPQRPSRLKARRSCKHPGYRRPARS